MSEAHGSLSSSDVEMVDHNASVVPSGDDTLIVAVTTRRDQIRRALQRHANELDIEELGLIDKQLKSGTDADLSQDAAVLASKRERLTSMVARLLEQEKGKQLRDMVARLIPSTTEHETHHKLIELDWASSLLIAWQVVLIVLYYVFCDYEKQDKAITAQNLQVQVAPLYVMYLGIATMMIFGFGYLMTFLRRYGFGAVGYTLLLTSCVVQWGILCQAFLHEAHAGSYGTINLSISWLIEGHFAAATFLISFGAVIGKTTAEQLVLMAFVETMFYSLNYYIGFLKLKAVDIGGSMFIHTFGGIFGLFFSKALLKRNAGKHEDNRSRYTSDMFAFIGTAFLWLFWPSFNGAFAGDRQYRVVLNTALALTGSAVGTFICSKLLRPHHKYEMVDVCNAVLAGGVAVGSSSDLIIGPGSAILIGVVSGSLSVFLYVFCQPYLERTIGLNDTCGIQALHAGPGIMGAVGGIIACGSAAAEHSLYGEDFSTVFPHGDNQASYQFAALAVTIGIAVVGGVLTAWFVGWMTRNRPMKDEERFQDSADWVVPSGEYDTIREQEELHSMFEEREKLY
eukprot:ANDGO_05651.mRNA.1 hypothetical protein